MSEITNLYFHCVTYESSSGSEEVTPKYDLKCIESVGLLQITNRLKSVLFSKKRVR